MRTAKVLIVLSMFAPAVIVACGGGDSNTSTNTPTTSATTATTSAPPASTTAAAASSAPETKPPTPSFTIAVAAAKFTPDKTAKIKAIEVKDDGSVTLAGKPAYKFSGNELQGTDGKAMLKADKDGNVTQGDGSKAFGKFDDKDVLQIPPSMAISIADDGKLKVMDNPTTASKTIAGKFDKVDPKGRRALEMVIGIEWMLSASMPK